jgi:peptidoglycan/LPS O-acetylase OafA/YrhL
MATTTTNGDRRWPALDGLRALAVIAVVVYHLDPGGERFPGGYTGVNVFFVLSGFLITSLLVTEFQRAQRIDFRAFWMRRVIRLAPALLVTMFVAVLLAGAGIQAVQPHETLVGLPWVILYVGNFIRVFNQNALGVLGHTWSLSVEEQFYLLWPPLFVFLAAKRPALAWKVLLAVAVAAGIWGHIATVAYGEARGNFGTDTNCYSLLGGCALALWYSQHPDLRARSVNWVRTWQLLSLLAVVGAIIMMIVVAETTYTMTPQIGAVTVCTLVVLIQIIVAPGGPLQALLESRVAVWIGRRSYAIYLFHYVIITAWAENAHGFGSAVVKVTQVFATLVAAWLSWDLLERPVQRRFKPRWQRTALTAEPAGVPVGAELSTS